MRSPKGAKNGKESRASPLRGNYAGPLKWNFDLDREVQVSGSNVRAARHTPTKLCDTAKLRAPCEEERMTQTSQGAVRTGESHSGDVIP